MDIKKININGVESDFGIDSSILEHFEIVDNPEWVAVTLDDENHIIEGINNNGIKYINNITSPIIDIINNRFTNYQTTTNDQLIDINDKLKNSSVSTSFNYKRIYTTSFSNFSNWVYSSATDGTKNTWIISNGAKPTKFGGYSLNGTTLYSYSTLMLNNTYYSNVRKAVYNVILYKDSIVDFHIFNGFENKQSVNISSSMYSIFCQQKILTMGKKTDILSPLYTQEIPFDIIDGREYQIECSRVDWDFTFKITDTITSESISLNCNGIQAGNNMCFFGISQRNGNEFITLKNFSIYEPYGAKLVLIGDSITEGSGYNDVNHAPTNLNCQNVWSYRIAKMVGNSYVCGKGGATIDDCISTLNHEVIPTKPQYVMITIGTNNPNTTKEQKITKYKEIKKLCDDANICLILNHIPLSSWDFNDLNLHYINNPQVNPLIDREIDGYHVKFDIANAIDNLVSYSEDENGNITINGDCDNSLTYDNGMHPNAKGADAMVKRVQLDCPFLFQ